MPETLDDVCRTLPSDFEPYGKRPRSEGARNCSTGFGCRWFCQLQGKPSEWGVCLNPSSPRSGLLTFAAQGCPAFERRTI